MAKKQPGRKCGSGRLEKVRGCGFSSSPVYEFQDSQVDGYAIYELEIYCALYLGAF